MENEKGISDYLLDHAGLEEIIKRPDAENKNLYVISSGEVLTEPSEQLGNDKLYELLTKVEDIFDYVVLDTAPINIISDGYRISTLCDASLFVTRYKYTPKSELRTFRENSSSRRLKNIGVVL